MQLRFYRSTSLAALALLVAPLFDAPVFAQVLLEQSGKLNAGDEQLSSGEFIDNFTIEGRAGDLLEVEATSDDFDAYLIVRGPDDARFDNDDADSTTRNPRIIERLPADGSYTIGVTSFQAGETGRYRLVASTSERPIDISLLSSAEGALGSGDEQLESGEFVDNFTFTGEAGDLVELRLSSTDFDPYLMLRGPGGASFDNDDAAPGDTNALITATLPASGEYRIMATSYAAGERGAYRLDAAGAQIAAQPVRDVRSQFGNAGAGEMLTVGTSVSGTLAPRDEQLESGEFFDIYTLQAAPGTRLSLRLRSDAFDTYLAAFGSDGFQATNDDDATGGTTDSRIEVMMPVSGTLTVAATSYAAGETGGYTLVAEPSSAASGGPIDPGTSTPLTLGDAVAGMLEASDDRGQRGIEDSFVFQAAAQQEIDFALTSADFDTFLLVEGPDGFSAENDDDPRARTLNSRIRTVLPEAGTYRIVVTSYDGEGTGSYRLRTGAAANAEGEVARNTLPLVLGEKLTGTLGDADNTLETGEYADFYRFDGQRGQRLTFTMESDEFDTLLALDMPDGRREENDDRAGMEDTNSRLAITLPEDGVYQLTATSFAPGMAGTYSLTMQTAEDSVRTVVPTSSRARVFALSIGVADYERMDSLPHTDQDAIKLTQTLAANGVLAPESVTLVNSEATRENVVAALLAISGQIGPDDLLLMFFSGHGDKVEGVDTEMDGSSETIELFDAALHDYELTAMFADIHARTLLVIDACFSGGFDNVIDQRIDRMGIFSSDSDVLSLVAEKYQAGGYVSLLLREALEGRADSNGDQAITAGELSEYMRRGFYRIALEAPLDAGGEDFRGEETLGYQHLIVDRGGDGMPYGQILLRTSASEAER